MHDFTVGSRRETRSWRLHVRSSTSTRKMHKCSWERRTRARAQGQRKAKSMVMLRHRRRLQLIPGQPQKGKDEPKGTWAEKECCDCMKKWHVKSGCHCSHGRCGPRVSTWNTSTSFRDRRLRAHTTRKATTGWMAPRSS